MPFIRREELLKDKSYVLKYLHKDVFLLQCIYYFKSDQEISLKSIKLWSSSLSYFENSLKSNKNFVLESLSIDDSLYNYIDRSLKYDPDILAVKVYIVKYSS